LKATSNIEDWPFDDPQNVAVVTTREITKENAPILLVSHDETTDGNSCQAVSLCSKKMREWLRCDGSGFSTQGSVNSPTCR
jgi:hypothetical protein